VLRVAFFFHHELPQVGHTLFYAVHDPFFGILVDNIEQHDNFHSEKDQ